MEFHPRKCSLLPVTRNRDVLEMGYVLHGHTLDTVGSSKYLGITINTDLNWTHHIKNICSKANTALAFLRRTLKINSRKIKEIAYKTYVRPIVEYACTVWDPYTQRNIDRIEAIQRRAARFVLRKYQRTHSVTSMLQDLKWDSLKER